jgi:hypothetical protein
MNNNDFKGFSLFNDIEDYVLRVRNRAVTLANMAEDNSEKGLINVKGVAYILGYFKMVPEDEREDVQTKFKSTMAERGFRITA